MSLLQKKPADKKPVLTPAWHPNFRNLERLPDTKTVRTSFFINVGAGFVTLLLLLLTLSREITMRGYITETARLQADIDRDEPKSKAQVELYKKYQEEEKKLLELRDFTATKFVFSDFLLHLGSTLPPKFAISLVDYHAATGIAPGNIALRGIVRAALNDAAGYLDDYISQLRTDPEFAPQFESVDSPTSPSRDPNGWVTFELSLKLKDTAPKPAKEKEAPK